jgi:hypothetical protein
MLCINIHFQPSFFIPRKHKSTEQLISNFFKLVALLLFTSKSLGSFMYKHCYSSHIVGHIWLMWTNIMHLCLMTFCEQTWFSIKLISQHDLSKSVSLMHIQYCSVPLHTKSLNDISKHHCDQELLSLFTFIRQTWSMGSVVYVK